MQSSISPFARLPTELLHLIVRSCDDDRDVAAWALTNRHYNAIIGRILYETAVAEQNYHVVFWAAREGRTATLRRWTSIRKPDGSNRASLNVYSTRSVWSAHPTLIINPSDSSTLIRRHSKLCAPLHVASWYGHTDTVEFMLDHGVDIDTQSRGFVPNGLTVFNDARDRAGAWDPSLTLSSLHVAVIVGQAEVAKLLLYRGAEIRVTPLGDTESLGVTALHLAAAHGVLPIVRMIGERPDVDVNGPDIDGQPPLLYAAQKPRGLPSFEVLKDLGADLNYVIRGRDGTEQTLLVTLIRTIRWKAAVELIDLGASMDAGEGQMSLLDECERAKMSVIHPDVPDHDAWEDLVRRIQDKQAKDGKTKSLLKRMRKIGLKSLGNKNI
ncbi:ankyrin repeat-containing domain protein [Xylariales sp. AK1849]|nr:ankyrin repeat-containing domain protein [Xylariales sp. AK1849]